jgi:hypothetical protein
VKMDNASLVEGGGAVQREVSVAASENRCSFASTDLPIKPQTQLCVICEMNASFFAGVSSSVCVWQKQ